MDAYERWRRVLLVLSGMFCVGGVLCAVFDTSLLPPYDAAIGEAFYGGALPGEARALLGFLFAPLGGTIAGFYVFQLFIVQIPLRRRERWAWHAIVWSTLLWFVVDSSMSIATGAAFNAWMINVPTLVIFGVPLGAMWRGLGEGAAPG